MKRNQKGEAIIGMVIFVLLALGVVTAGVNGTQKTSDAGTVQVAESQQ